MVGGAPGIGKSTLLLQICNRLCAERRVLYISGEESQAQVRLRASRINAVEPNLLLASTTDLSTVLGLIEQNKPALAIVDSAQTIVSQEVDGISGGSTQVREVASALIDTAKTLDIPVFLVGHVTKDGSIAGPRTLEHLVDVVCQFEGDSETALRMLRAVKNRFGSTNEIGVFEMEADGLHEVKNPSEFMLNGKPEEASGSIVVCSMEGTRPILIEIQALICHSNFGIPRRQAIGTDFNRVNLLMAVLEKRLGLQMGNCDAYVNIAGGIRISEPAIDLGIALAIISSFKNKVIDEKTIAMGEIGLSGEVRAVSMIPVRVQEAKKLGFTTCIIPAVCVDSVKNIRDITILGVKSVADAMQLI